MATSLTVDDVFFYGCEPTIMMIEMSDWFRYTLFPLSWYSPSRRKILRSDVSIGNVGLVSNSPLN